MSEAYGCGVPVGPVAEACGCSLWLWLRPVGGASGCDRGLWVGPTGGACG